MTRSAAATLITAGTLLIIVPPTFDLVGEAIRAGRAIGEHENGINSLSEMSGLYRLGCFIAGAFSIAAGVGVVWWREVQVTARKRVTARKEAASNAVTELDSCGPQAGS